MSLHASEKQRKRLAACLRDKALREAGHATVASFLRIPIADISARGTIFAESLSDPVAIAAVAWGGFAIPYWTLGYELKPNGVCALLERYRGASDYDTYLLNEVRDRFGEEPVRQGLLLAKHAIEIRWDTMETIASELRKELSGSTL
ncbi:MAG: hypothetical protein WAK53_05695 [Chromatiaceae bacterium]|jgi:hypothetical protein